MPTRPSSSRPPAPRVIKKVMDSDEPSSRYDVTFLFINNCSFASPT